MKFYLSLLLLFSGVSMEGWARLKYDCKKCCGKKILTITETKRLRIITKYIAHFSTNYKDGGVRFYKYVFNEKGEPLKYVLIKDAAHFEYVIKKSFREHGAVIAFDRVEESLFLKAAQKCKQLKQNKLPGDFGVQSFLGWHLIPFDEGILDT
jgi:hypothetical protein